MKNKAFLTLIVSVAMLMTWIITPIKVKAQDVVESFHSNVPVVTMTDSEEVSDYVRDAACRAFPEYASKIQANQAPSTFATQNQSMEKPEIVIKETRAISDNENVTYTEYSNGVSMLSGTYTIGKNIINTQGSEPAYSYTFNAWLQILGSYDTMLIENIILGIAPDYSHFANFGYVSPASSTNSATRAGYRQGGSAL